MPRIDETALTKGEQRKLNALRRSVGDDLGESTFIKWLAWRDSQQPAPVRDKVADSLVVALRAGLSASNVNLGRYGYVIQRSRQNGAESQTFVARKLTGKAQTD